MTKESRIATYGALIRLMVCLVVLGVGSQFSIWQGSNMPQYLPVPVPIWLSSSNVFAQIHQVLRTGKLRCTSKE